MSTLSVPLSDELIRAIDRLVEAGIVSNKAELARRAIQLYVEDLAVSAVLTSENEPTLYGDLTELAKKL